MLSVSREDWTNSGVIRELNLTGKLILKVLEVEVILYKFYFKALIFCMQFLMMPDIEAISLHPLEPR